MNKNIRKRIENLESKQNSNTSTLQKDTSNFIRVKIEEISNNTAIVNQIDDDGNIDEFGVSGEAVIFGNKSDFKINDYALASYSENGQFFVFKNASSSSGITSTIEVITNVEMVNGQLRISKAKLTFSGSYEVKAIDVVVFQTTRHYHN